MIAYKLFYFAHVTTATISITLFVLRGLGMMVGAGWLRWRWVRVLPHVNDSVLLLSAVLLAWTTQQYPLQQHWLTAKLTALIAYILLGMVALRWGPSRGLRIAAWLAALVTFGYIVAVALQRSPAPW